MANGRLLLPDERLPRPAVRRYGLLSTATQLPVSNVVNDDGAVSERGLDRHWQAGLTWQANCPEVSATYAECLTLDGSGVPTVQEPQDKAQPAGQTVDRRGATPFTAFAEVDCSAVGSWERGKQWARDALIRDEERQAEEVFALGVTASGNPQTTWPNLSGVQAAPTSTVVDDSGVTMQIPVDDVTPAGGPVDVVYALAVLEAALAECYSQQGFIHVPYEFAALLSAWNLCFVDEDGDLVTKAGNKVVLGAGYPGNAPGTGATDPVRYMYATGQVFYARSDEITFRREEEFDRAKNTLKAIAERTYVIGFDCNCLLAIGVDVSISGACCEAVVS